MKVQILILLMLVPWLAKGQSYDTLKVGLLTTEHIIFSSPVVDWDLGSGTRMEGDKEVSDVIISKVGDRIKLAASLERFETTNLFVETETAYFNFIIVYSDKPHRNTHYITDERADHLKARGTYQKETLAKQDKEIGKAKDEMILELTLKDLATEVSKKTNTIPELGESTQKVKYFLNGIYVKGDYIFFRVNILNKADVIYNLGYEGFFIKDKQSKGTKKTPTQPLPVKCLFILNEEKKTVQKNEEISKVYVFKLFTLEHKKLFHIEYWEDGEGQRRVELKIPADHLLEAKSI